MPLPIAQLWWGRLCRSTVVSSGIWGRRLLPAGAFLRSEALEASVCSTFLQLSSLHPSPPRWSGSSFVLGGPAKNLSNVPQEKARPAQWALRLARSHPLTRCMEIKHGGDKQLGGVEMSARHPESPVSMELAAGKGCPESKLLDGSAGGSSSGCSEPGDPGERVSVPGAHLTQASLHQVPGDFFCFSTEFQPGQVTGKSSKLFLTSKGPSRWPPACLLPDTSRIPLPLTASSLSVKMACLVSLPRALLGPGTQWLLHYLSCVQIPLPGVLRSD